MDSPHTSLLFYIQVVTGLLLVLDAALLISLRYGMKWAKQLSTRVPEPERTTFWPRATRVLGALVLLAIGINAAAIYAHHQLRQSALGVAPDGGGSSTVLIRAAVP